MKSVVVGIGKTGASCLRYFARHGIPAAATDSRAAPPGLASLGPLAQSLDLRLSGFDLGLLDGASQLLMSPGVSLEEPIARAARARGIEVLGDVELFARAVQAPVIGVTGTNGKSTVTSLVAAMAKAAGRRVLAGGNLGEPALDLLEPPPPDLYVLELSSFQLETTSSLALTAAVVLNVTSDHQDRYASLREYADAKARIYAHAATWVINADDPRVTAMADEPAARGVAEAPRTRAPRDAARRMGAPRVLRFSTQHQDADYTLLHEGARTLLARDGSALLDTARMPLQGLHNAANALAALALGDAAGLPLDAMLDALESFSGLPHRSTWVADIAGVQYVDDSKGTNVGATLAAVAGMPGPLVVIAGGQGKGQDFGPLAAAFRGKVRHAVLLGQDAPLLAEALAGACAFSYVTSMDQAVGAAAALARSGDTVLLSPACASLDMFRDYGHRGDEFAASVRALKAVS